MASDKQSIITRASPVLTAAVLFASACGGNNSTVAVAGGQKPTSQSAATTPASNGVELGAVRPDLTPSAEKSADFDPNGLTDANIRYRKWLISTMTPEDAKVQLEFLAELAAAKGTAYQALINRDGRQGERQLLIIPTIGAGWVDVGSASGAEEPSQVQTTPSGRAPVFRASTGTELLGEFDGASFYPADGAEPVAIAGDLQPDQTPKG